jgi:hypothetical protein
MPAVPCTQTLLGLTEQTARERQVAQDSKARRQEAASSRQEQLKAQFLQKQVGATAGLPAACVLGLGLLGAGRNRAGMLGLQSSLLRQGLCCILLVPPYLDHATAWCQVWRSSAWQSCECNPQVHGVHVPVHATPLLLLARALCMCTSHHHMW